MAFGNGLDNSVNDEVMSEINMTPMVDVMLVLLIIFIIAMPLLTHTIQIDLPTADSSPHQAKPESVTLSVTANGVSHWNGKPLLEDALNQALQTAAQQQPQPEIHLRGDRKVEYEHVVKVMAAAQRAGITKLGFVTEPDS